MSAPSGYIPTYRYHRPSGQARVTIAGRDLWLGPYGTPESRERYDRIIAEWLAAGRTLPQTKQDQSIKVVELVDRFWTFAQGYYRKADGTPTSEVDNYRDALRPLKRLYGSLPAVEFGPLALDAVRMEMVKLGWVRTTINRAVSRVRHMFKWAVGKQLIPASIHQGLMALDGLKAGRSDAQEPNPVKPVADAHAEAVLPWLSRQVAAMVRLQRLTGMRPGEVVAMRRSEIDQSGKLWQYKPAQHKTKHRGHERIVYLGPQAQAILAEFFKADLAACLFSPADSEAERRGKRHAARKTPLSCGNIPGSNVKDNPGKAPGQHYTVESYHRAVTTACDKADAWAKGGKVIGNDERIIPRWHPNQLRHSTATDLRKNFGLEAAQVILGHKTLTVTQVYAEKNIEAAQKIMAAVG